jgi:hypothetical protein
VQRDRPETDVPVEQRLAHVMQVAIGVIHEAMECLVYGEKPYLDPHSPAEVAACRATAHSRSRLSANPNRRMEGRHDS